MSFGKGSSFVFVMQDDKLINIGRSDNSADRQPFDAVEEEVWRIFGEYKELKDKNERLHKALAIATDYVEHESTRTTIGQLYDIEQALKD